MAILNPIASNWSRAEREKLNNNWTIIERYLSNLQGQINLLTGDVDVQALIDQINEILNQGNVVIADLQAALQDASTVISDARNATNNATDAAQAAINAVADIQSIISNFGSKGIYDNSAIYKKNNIVYDDGCSYIYINNTPGSGNPPPTYPTISNDHWHRLADKGASGSGAVSTVNGKGPNGSGEVTLVPSDIGAASSTDLTTLDDKVTTHLADIAINVKDYGAKGNANYFFNGNWYEDSSFTLLANDDTNAIQSAINYLDSVGGGTLLIPIGTYLTDSIIIHSNITLIGQNKNLSILRLKYTPSGALLELSGTATNVKNSISIENLTLKHRVDFNRINDEIGTLIRGYYTSCITLKNVILSDFSVHGILTSQIDNANTIPKSWVIKNCDFINGRGYASKAIFAYLEAEYIIIDSCRFYNCKTAIDSFGSANILVSNCLFLLCGETLDAGRYVIAIKSGGDNVGKFKMIGCKINHSKNTPVYISLNGFNNMGAQIVGNEFLVLESGNMPHILIEGTKAVMVNDNQFDAGTGKMGGITLTNLNTFITDWCMVRNNQLRNSTISNISTGANNDINGNMSIIE